MNWLLGFSILPHGSAATVPVSRRAVSRTIKSGVIGGTVAEIGGGKFANGAYTAAFQHLLNAEAGRERGKVDASLDAERQRSPISNLARDAGRHVADFIGKLWTLPNSVLGVVAGLTSLPIGGSVNFGYNAIVFSNLWFQKSPFFKGVNATTLGNDILAGSSFEGLDRWIPTYHAREGGPLTFAHYGRHEMGHTYQSQVLGVGDHPKCTT